MGVALLMAMAAMLADRGPLERLGTLGDPAIAEASGIVQSRRHPGIFWVHNDSGNAPALYAVRRDGTLVNRFQVAVPNVDWEDIAIDDAGHLYIGEIGNNDGALPLRAVYRVDEPDPNVAAKEPLPVTLASFYRFPKGERFDAESLVVRNGRALLIAKTFDGREAKLFAVPLDPPSPLLRPALPERLGTLPRFTEPATGADLSADGRWLAVCSTKAARIYRREGDGDASWSLAGQVTYPSADIEAICWDGLDLVLASEGRTLYRLPASAWRAREKAKPVGAPSRKPDPLPRRGRNPDSPSPARRRGPGHRAEIPTPPSQGLPGWPGQRVVRAAQPQEMAGMSLKTPAAPAAGPGQGEGPAEPSGFGAARREARPPEDKPAVPQGPP